MTLYLHLMMMKIFVKIIACASILALLAGCQTYRRSGNNSPTATTHVNIQMNQLKDNIDKLLPAQATVNTFNKGLLIQVVLPAATLFSPNSNSFESTGKSLLQQIAEQLLLYPETNVKVVAHSDHTGKEELNQLLTNKRAQRIKQLLVTQGVYHKRVITEGKGFSDPVADNRSMDGRNKNRRIEIFLMPGSVPNPSNNNAYQPAKNQKLNPKPSHQ